MADLFFSKKQPPTIITLPTPTPIKTSYVPDAPSFKFSIFQKTTIGKTTTKEVETIPDIINKINLSANETKYIIKSIDPLLEDEIIIRNGSVIFEKINTITDKLADIPKISYIKQVFGKPDEETQGSQAFGAFATTYIYATRGFALIGNTTTDNVYQVQRFLPMSLDEYKRIYGNDIKQEPNPGEN